ncbi:MAG: segregation/condensation protein A [Bacilli bacterium]|nr:segregation/condensation protein A [Bacilli bacterium]
MDHILLSNFEGPMDLLLHLVKQTKLDIYEVNISEIIEQYINYINNLQELNIDVASEYLIMAVDLVHIKSKKLINSDTPVEDEEVAITSEEDLKKKLIEYEKYKKISETFKELEENRQSYFTKIPESLTEYKDENTSLNTDLSLDDLINAFLQFKERQKYQKPLNTSVTKKELSVAKRISYIRERLKINKQVSFFDLFEDYSKDYVIVTFLSILDMSKNKEITIIQEDNFKDILIKAGEVCE